MFLLNFRVSTIIAGLKALEKEVGQTEVLLVRGKYSVKRELNLAGLWLQFSGVLITLDVDRQMFGVNILDAGTDFLEKGTEPIP